MTGHDSVTTEPLADRTIECRECGTPFVWTLGEQRYYAERDFSAPKKCRPCREAARARRDALKDDRLF
ncbi:MAG: zinc-ribbon domain containing protein [Vicinamibacterales bacterium]